MCSGNNSIQLAKTLCESYYIDDMKWLVVYRYAGWLVTLSLILCVRFMVDRFETNVPIWVNKLIYGLLLPLLMSFSSLKSTSSPNSILKTSQVNSLDDDSLEMYLELLIAYIEGLLGTGAAEPKQLGLLAYRNWSAACGTAISPICHDQKVQWHAKMACKTGLYWFKSK